MVPIQTGLPWMSLPFSEIREAYLQTVEEIQMRNEQLVEINKESMKPVVDLCRSEFHLVTSVKVDVGSDCYVAGDNTSGNSYMVEHPVFGCYPVSDTASELDATVKVKKRLQFSNYLINPNKYRFYKVVRINSVVMKVARLWLEKIGRQLNHFSYPLKKVDNPLINAEEVTCSNTGAVIALTDTEIQYSFDYFFQKATVEVKRFVDPKV